MELSPEERMAHAKEFGEHGGVNASIECSTTFTVLDAGTLPKIFQGAVGPKNGGCYVYGRSFNPTVMALSRQLAALEGTESAYCTSSGMAAISAALMGLCNAGDHIVASHTVYGGTFALLHSFLPKKCGITVTLVDITDLAAVAAAITPATKVIYTEAVSNPTLVVADLPALAALARAAGAKLVVDNTFTPCIVTPAKWGADVVVHSLTKFVSGASDIIAGVVCGSAPFINSLMDFHTGPLMLLGPTMDPKIASELALRVPHLPLRVQEHSRRALAMAQALQAQGARVVYPGLPEHSGHALLTKLANPGYGYGGLLGVHMASRACANALMERLQNKHSFGYMAVSLGYFDSLMCAPGASTSSELDEKDKAISGITEGYVRLSVGITGSLESRVAQLSEAYAFVSKVGASAPYRATKVQRTDYGAPQLMSWPSLGSDGESLSDAECEPLLTLHNQHGSAANAAGAAGGASGIPEAVVSGDIAGVAGVPAGAASPPVATAPAPAGTSTGSGTAAGRSTGCSSEGEHEDVPMLLPCLQHSGASAHMSPFVAAQLAAAVLAESGNAAGEVGSYEATALVSNKAGAEPLVAAPESLTGPGSSLTSLTAKIKIRRLASGVQVIYERTG